MLTADLAGPHSRAGILRVVPLNQARRSEAVALAHALLEAVRELVGSTREEVESALEAVAAGRDDVVARGVRRMVDDRCHYEQEATFDPVAARARLFSEAAERRLTTAMTAPFEREAVVADVARGLGITEEDLERGLYADLRALHRLVEVDPIDADELMDTYEFERAQAMLLRATQMRAKVAGGGPEWYRALFHRLKFHQLLFELRPADDGYIVDVEGPAAEFVNPVRYGLRLALALPSLASFPTCELTAEVRVGAKRERRSFLWTRPSRLPLRAPSAAPNDDVASLLARLSAHGGPWRVTPAQELLHLPGQMVCAPDLCFEHESSGDVIYLEVLGLWSRDAVWRRVELVEKGMSTPIVFAVSERLRVSGQALGDHPSASLLVYKGRLSPAAVMRAVEELAASVSLPSSFKNVSSAPGSAETRRARARGAASRDR